MSATWTIGNPQYIKDVPNSLPYYIFHITKAKAYDEAPVKSTADLSTSLMSAITPATLGNYLLDLYAAFLNVHQTRFAKPYTPAQLIRATTHTVETEGPAVDMDEDLQWTLVPTQIIVKNGAFIIAWRATGQTVRIELSAVEDLAAAPAAIPDIQEVEPVAEITEGFLRLTSNSQVEERRGVEEARIRAKWAQYKAQRAIAKYVEKYGEFDEEILSDSEESDESE